MRKGPQNSKCFAANTGTWVSASDSNDAARLPLTNRLVNLPRAPASTRIRRGQFDRRDIPRKVDSRDVGLPDKCRGRACYACRLISGAARPPLQVDKRVQNGGQDWDYTVGVPRGGGPPWRESAGLLQANKGC